MTELRAKQKKKRPDAELDVKKDIEEGRLLFRSIKSMNLGHQDFKKIRGLAAKMRWIYNLKKMLDNKPDELVFIGADEGAVGYKDLVNGEYYQYDEHVPNDEFEKDQHGEENVQIMTLKHCNNPETRGAVVGRTPFLLFVGTWNTEL